MSLFRYFLGVKFKPQFSQEKWKWLLHMSIFRHGSCLCSTPVDIWNMMIQQNTATRVNHSFHTRNKNGFFTWVSLGIFLLWSVNHSIHKRNENYFFTWVSLGIFLVWSFNISFHKRHENDFFTWVSLGIFLLFSVLVKKNCCTKIRFKLLRY